MGRVAVWHGRYDARPFSSNFDSIFIDFCLVFQVLWFVFWRTLVSGSSTGLTPFEVGPKKTRGARIASRASFLEIQALKTLLEDSCETPVVKFKELAKKRPKESLRSEKMAAGFLARLGAPKWAPTPVLLSVDSGPLQEEAKKLLADEFQLDKAH